MPVNVRSVVGSFPVRRHAPRQLPRERPTSRMDTLRQHLAESNWNVRFYYVSAYRVWKRTLDITIAGAAMIVLAPLMLAVAALIKMHDGGPVLYWQTRVGKKGAHIPFPKFRSMVMNAEALKASLAEKNEDEDGVKFKMKADPRVTAIGRFIRKYSIDELPQLCCVLRGDMTLVGPRPPLPSEVRKYTAHDWQRLDVVPGLTCLWQIRGRSDLSFKKQVALDLEYIRKRGFVMDVKILAGTIPAVLSARGAY